MKMISQFYKDKNVDTINVIRNVINAVIIKGGGIIVGLLTTPAYMNYFQNQEVLGVWFTILSVISWMLNFDLGIGNGLRNRLVEEIAVRNNKRVIRELISSAYIFLVSVSVVVCIFVALLVNIVDWHKFFGLSREAISTEELRTAVIIVMVSILLQLVLRLVTSIEFALQKSYIANLLVFITNTLILLYVLSANALGRNNNVIALAYVYLFSVNIPLIVTTIGLFGKKMQYAIPSIKYFKLSCAIDTLKLGGLFLFVQLEAMLLNNSSTILITRLCGPGAVVEYNVYFKVFSMVNTFYALVTIPIWSAVTKAMAEKNYLWIKRTMRVLQLIAIIFVIAQLFALPLMQLFFDIWLGNKSFTVNYRIMMCFALEQFFMVWSSLDAAICNGMNQIKLQLVYMTIGVVLLFSCSIFASHFTTDYIIIVIAHCIALAPYCLSQSIWLERHIGGSQVS